MMINQQPLLHPRATAPMPDMGLTLRGVTKAFQSAKGKVTALRDINLDIQRGEFITLIGHSGCGKSTLLNIIAGLAQATGGRVTLDGAPVTKPGPDRGVVFQNYSLLPWLTVRSNVFTAVDSVYPTKTLPDKNELVDNFLRKVGLYDHRDKKPGQISGGMKQRVAIARAFATHPKVLLLDEPFGALDALTRGTIQDELMTIVRDTQQTVFMITHDVDEAILLADRIILMTNGAESSMGYTPGGIGEVVTNTLPKKRTRADLHHLNGYYDLRNHIVDFLIKRAKPGEAH